MEMIPIKERNQYHCWFCGTNKSVKYKGEILNPCPWSDNRYLDIVICNKCVLLHEHHLKEYWDTKRQ